MKTKMKYMYVSTLFFLFLSVSCVSGSSSSKEKVSESETILTGADQLDAYLPLLEGKKVGMMGNQTSIVGKEKKHLVDVLFENEVDLRFAFAPEHGFRGEIERGEAVSNDVDEKTGLPLYTL